MQQPPSCKEIPSDSQISSVFEMMQVKAAQFAVRLQRWQMMDQMLMCFLAGSRAVVLTKLFRLLCIIFGHLDFRTDSFILQISDLPCWEGFMRKQLW